MSSAIYARMRDNPEFRRLVSTRGRFAWTLSIVVLVLFYGFVLAVAFIPAVLGRPVGEGSMLTIGVAVELALFIFFWLLSALYVRRANGEFDAMTEAVVRHAQKGGK